ncbi:MAG TPA: 3'-5' exonuclease, partial [Pirellulales bacterium]|nr:3'-5' exonuclease [Pirellulales bacterium]
SPVEEILGHVLSESGYQQFLKDSENEEDQERLANIEELLTAARQFDEKNPGEGRLEGFLEEACLVNDTDAWQVDDDRVTLMTLHASKGLEFPVVFIVALEEGLLPHERSQQSVDMLEEERRLLFVGITRAREELQLSLATYREFRGQRRRTVPSQFLMELPRGEMRVVEPPLSEPLSNDPAWVTEDELPWEAVGSDEAVEPGLESPLASGTISTSPLATAAELHGTEAAEKPHILPDAFHQGMVVRHPEYGLGKVVALSGSGARRSATIAFASFAGQKRFMLAQSQLRPAKSL